MRIEACREGSWLASAAVTSKWELSCTILQIVSVPRIKGIEEVAEKLKIMIPKVKLLIAHGQMEEGALENAMIAFNAGDADILLCTTVNL